MYNVKFLLLLITLVIYSGITAQVAINSDGSSSDNSAMLDVKSNSSGVLIPRMTLSERNAIGEPGSGLLIYQTDITPGFYYYNGSSWYRIGGASSHLSNNKILIGDNSNEAQEVNISGDAILSNAGVLTLGNDVIESSNISPAAIQASDLANGSVWTQHILNSTILGEDVHPAAGIQATSIASSIVDDTEFEYLDGATQNIQGQITSIMDSIGTPGTVESNRIVIVNSSRDISNFNNLQADGTLTSGNSITIDGTGDTQGIISESHGRISFDDDTLSTTGAMVIGASIPSSSAAFEISSTTKGFLPPRMTAQQIIDMVDPVNGLMVFNTNDESLYIYITSIGLWKELDFGGGVVTPVIFSIGAGGACSNTVVSGNYSPGNELDSDDTINIDVTVTKAGAWGIHTDTINGYSFSGSGWFTGTGTQTVTLYGSGWPINLQTDQFTATADAAGDFTECTFDITVTGAPLAVGDYFQEGVIVYLDGSGGGMICSVVELALTNWGCSGTDIASGNGANGQGIGDGPANTQAIITDCQTADIAADTCNNFTVGNFSDWYLPSVGELGVISGANITAINASCVANGGTAFTNTAHWTSSEYNLNSSRWYHPYDGTNGTSSKTGNHVVRAFRNF